MNAFIKIKEKRINLNHITMYTPCTLEPNASAGYTKNTYYIDIVYLNGKSYSFYFDSENERDLKIEELDKYLIDKNL